MRECIVRFDEDIAMKANRSDLTLMKSALEEDFISFDKFTTLNARFELFEGLFSREKAARDLEF